MTKGLAGRVGSRFVKIESIIKEIDLQLHNVGIVSEDDVNGGEQERI